MSDKLQENAELVSALVDGQLQGDELGQAFEHLGMHPQAREDWDIYHLMGEAMRSASTPLRAHDPMFIQRLRREMASDASLLIAQDDLPTTARAQKHRLTSGANDSHWRRVVGLASVVVIGVLTWQGYALMGVGTSLEAAPQIAQVPVPAHQPVQQWASSAANGVQAAPPVMIRDPQLDALMAAHRQLGGATALQMPSGFLRNATFTEGNR